MASGTFLTKLSPEAVRDISVSANPDLSDHPEFAAVVEYWRGKHHDGRIPHRGHIDPLELKEHLGSLFIAEADIDADDFRYRLMGTDFIAFMGGDYTGKLMREVYSASEPPYHDGALFLYQRCVCEVMPIYVRADIVHENLNLYAFDAIQLPISSDGHSVDMVLGKICIYRDGEVLKRSPFAVDPIS